MSGSLSQGMQRPIWCLTLAALLFFAGFATLSAHNVAPEPVVDVFLQPAGSQLVVKVWLPMIALADANLPRTSDGRLNQDQIRPALDLVARGIARDLALQQGDESLLARNLTTTLSPDESFVAIDLNYPMSAGPPDVSGRFHTFRGYGQVITTRVHYIVDDRTTRLFVVDAEPQKISFTPSVAEVFQHFMGTAIDALLAGTDFLLFAVCLIAVARSTSNTQASVGSFITGQSLMILASVGGLFALSSTSLAGLSALAASAIVVLAIQDVASPHSRWLPALCFAFGLMSAARVGATLTHEYAFAGTHTFSALLIFVATITLGEIWAVGLLSAAAGVIRRRGRIADLAVMSSAIFAGHAALHRVADEGQLLADAGAITFDRFVMALTLAWAGVILCAGIVEMLVERGASVTSRVGVQPTDLTAQ